jgi:NAD(P) transhydrogenase subunit alpha
MPLRVGVPKETQPGERRVAIDPSVAERMAKKDIEVLIQKGAGKAAAFPDEAYANAKVVGTAKSLYDQAEVILKIQPPTEKEVDQLEEGSVIISFMQGHNRPEVVKKLRDRKITSFAMELVPRISRAQSMDALSSQAAIAGYKAAIMGADLANVFFPMLTTAAGTIRPAKVLVIGAGVAGLQAIATARRLGAMVSAYDIRAAAREQVESLGAKMVDTGVNAEGAGGYARELTDEEKAKQAEALAKTIADSRVVISTAALPGRPSPRIITREMVEAMAPGSVIVDLAAEGGGNCELTTPGKTVEHQGVIIHGPLDVPSQVPQHASEMYAKNMLNLLDPMIKDGKFDPDWEDEVVAGCLLTRDGEIKHQPTRELFEKEVTDKEEGDKS